MNRMSRTCGLLAAPLALVLLPLAATAQHSSHVQHALHELRHARTEVLNAKHDYGGHREKSIRAINDAIRQLEILAGHPHHRQHATDSKYKPGTEKHPAHLHHALHELKHAR